MRVFAMIQEDNYVLYIKTEDGKTGLLDIKLYLESNY